MVYSKNISVLECLLKQNFILLLWNDRHLFSLSTLWHRLQYISQVSAESLPHILWFFLQVGVNEWQSAQMWGCIRKIENVSLEMVKETKNYFRRPFMEVPNCSRLSSTPLPGLWWAMSRHWLSCKPWEEINIECHVSISLRWLGTSGLNMITTPPESFISAGQHDSNL